MAWLSFILTPFRLAISFVKELLAPLLAYHLGKKHQKANELKKRVRQLEKENYNIVNMPRTRLDRLKRLREWRDRADK